MPVDDQSLTDLGTAVLLEDYKLWQRELEKQDRWFSQALWTVLAGASAGFMLIRPLQVPVRVAAECVLVVVAGLFVSMSGDFLVGRVRSYLVVARHVAAVRKATGSLRGVALPDQFAAPGAPLISDSPEAYARTSVAGARSPFRALYSMHQAVLVLLYVLLGVALSFDLATPIWWEASAGLGFVHLLAFSLLFKWRASEAETSGEFAVTVARDLGLGVARDGEARLLSWVRRFRRDTSVVSEAKEAWPAMVAWEDHRFWQHGGVDWISVASVLVRRRSRGGASTIGMQLARQLIKNPHVRATRRSRLIRKLFEATLARWLIKTVGHRVVLAAWLESIPFGHSSVIGVRDAARAYLGKNLADLDVVDGVLLAERISISSGKFDPARQQRVIAWAASHGFLTQPQQEDALGRARRMRDWSPS